MEIPGNMWIEIWETAKPIPAYKQKRLFDEVKEGEKILFYLETRTPQEVLQLLLPVIIVCVIEMLLKEAFMFRKSSEINDMLQRLIKKVERLGRMPKIETSSYEVGNQIIYVFILCV